MLDKQTRTSYLIMVVYFLNNDAWLTQLDNNNIN